MESKQEEGEINTLLQKDDDAKRQQVATCSDSSSDPNETDLTKSKLNLNNQKEILKALELVEKESAAIAQSFNGLFSSLRSALSEVTSNSVNHMECFAEATGRLQESVLDAATKGNQYINSCLRLNEEMKGVDTLAAQLKILRRNVDLLDTAVNRIVRSP